MRFCLLLLVTPSICAEIYCDSSNTSLPNYCHHPEACKQKFNDLSELADTMPLEACRNAYYTPTCEDITMESFNISCLPPMLSNCENESIDSTPCTRHTVNLWFIAELCGMDALKLKYGPDKLLTDRRVVYKRLFEVILENVLNFVFPVLISITACLIFHAKVKKNSKPADPTKRSLFKKCIDVASALFVLMTLALALWTASCTLIKCWVEVHKYYQSLDLGARCNFIFMIEFIGYKHVFELLALAVFTIMDFILVLTLVFWSCILCISATCAQACCMFRLYICCIPCKYCTCCCFCCQWASILCTFCALFAFIVALLPLVLYFGAVAVGAAIVYAIFAAIIILSFLLIVLVIRNILAYGTCLQLIEPVGPATLVNELRDVSVHEVQRAFIPCVDPNAEQREKDDPTKPEWGKSVDFVGKIVKFAAITILFPILLLFLSALLYPLAEQLAMIFTLNFGDVEWVYLRGQDPLQPWAVLFQYQWWYMAEGITDFAKDAFTTWPLGMYANVADTATNGSSVATDAFEKNLDLMRMWWAKDFYNYKVAIMVARAWMSFFEGVIVTMFAVKYAYLDNKLWKAQAEYEDDTSEETSDDEATDDSQGNLT